MIVKDHSTFSPISGSKTNWLLWGVFGCVMLVVLGRFMGKWENQAAYSANEFQVYCDAEATEKSDGELVFLSDGTQFRNGNSQSSERARSGSYSSRLDETHRFGMLYEIPAPQPEDRYRISVWRYGNNNPFTYLTVNITGDEAFYRQEGEPIQTDEAGWVKIEYLFSVPRGFGNGKVAIYVYGGGRDAVYFDDLEVEKIPKDRYLDQVLSDTTLPRIDLRIEPNRFQKIEAKRRDAIAQGILVSTDEDWVKGAIMEESDKIPVKLRLKGDWMDHLLGDKWSFRIRAKTPHAWNQMLTFSIQNPRVRHYLSEWLYHQFMKREDVLSTRYDFVRLELNGEAKGIFAYEEHFEKQLPENQNRREGPVIKLQETGVWNSRKRNMDLHPSLAIENELSNFEASQVKPFRESKTKLDTALARQFEIAQQLLQQYKFGERPISEVFDIKRLARYYAITDLTQGYHSLVWHNQRFYYNPVISKLEPIGYDGFTEEGIFQLYNKPFSAYAINARSGHFHNDLHINPFLDPAFVRVYVQELERMSRTSYIETLLMDIEPALRARERALQVEYPNYIYTETLTQRARQIRAVLFPINQDGVQAYLQSKGPNRQTLSVANYHVLPLEVVGFGKNNQEVTSKPDTLIWLPAYQKGTSPHSHELIAPAGITHVFYQLPGLDSLYQSEISAWKRPEAAALPPAQALFDQLKLKDTEFYSLSDSLIQFRPGSHEIKQDILIPEGYVVQFPAGTELNLTNKARFVSKSQVQMIGEAEQPIRIYSSDKSARGFTILQAKGLSRMHYVIFDDFDTFDYQGWTLTGAVTAYESDIEIDHCSFLNAHCEDGLNLIRSTFSMKHSLISNTFSDGFDADFCTGEVVNTRFEHTGNDGMDLSGSTIEIKDCHISQAGDKGISVGERAEVTVLSAVIDGAVTGVASKDLSFLHIHNLDLSNCQTGFAAYQKKPEYGGAKLWVDRFTDHNVRHLHLVEKGSEVKLRGQLVEGI